MDTGCRKTVFPFEENGGKEMPDGHSYRFRTATGEVVRSEGAYRQAGKSEWNQAISLKGVKAPVSKICVAVGDVTAKGNDFVLSDSLGDGIGLTY